MSKTKFKQTETCGEHSPEQAKRVEGRSRTIGEIPEGWDVQAVADLPIDIIDGDRGTNYPKKNEFEKQGFCLFLSTKNVPGERFDFSECDFISRKRDRVLRKGKLQKEDIVLTTRGTIGNIAYYQKHIPYEHIRINSGMVIIRNAGDKFDTKYLYHLLKSPIVKQQYLSFATGSAQPQLPIRDINKIRLILPSISEQRAIAKILSDLDEKIELNRQMNKTLESIAQAIFKRWFVDFEFPDKNGKPYNSSGGKLVDSELGDIPEGWTVSNLEDTGTFKNGINYLRNEAGDTEFFIANVRDIANNKLLLKESLDKIKINLGKAKEYLLQEKDILIARSAIPGEISLVLGDLKNVIYSGFSIRYRLYNPGNYLYIYYVIQGLKRNLQNYSIGTTLQSVNQVTLKNMKLILPSDETLKEFNKISKQILDKTLNNLIQNRELSQIRDSLLPKLMSGRIRLNNL